MKPWTKIRTRRVGGKCWQLNLRIGGVACFLATSRFVRTLNREPSTSAQLTSCSAEAVGASSGDAVQGLAVSESEIVESERVPDVLMDDGADAVSELEAAGSSVTLADADADSSFHSARPPDEQAAQQPAAGWVLVVHVASGGVTR